MKTHRVKFIFLFLISLLVAGYWYMTFQGLGFPDGHLTEVDRYLKVAYPIYIVIHVLIAAGSLFLVLKPNQKTAARSLRLTFFLFIGFFMLCLAFNAYLMANFEHGTGG